jgi:hypothetical protein
MQPDLESIVSRSEHKDVADAKKNTLHTLLRCARRVKS